MKKSQDEQSHFQVKMYDFGDNFSKQVFLFFSAAISRGKDLIWDKDKFFLLLSTH